MAQLTLADALSLTDREWQALTRLGAAPFRSLEPRNMPTVGPRTLTQLLDRGLIEQEPGSAAGLMKARYFLTKKGWAAVRWRHQIRDACGPRPAASAAR